MKPKPSPNQRLEALKNLNEKDMKNIIESFMNDKPLKPGSYRGRKNSAPDNNHDDSFSQSQLARYST